MEPDSSKTLRRLATVAGLALLAGCAHVWVDSEGNRHIVGAMVLTLPPMNPQAAAETLNVRTVGLTWTQAEAGNALVLGYGDTTLGFLRNDVCVAPVRAAHLETSR
ncbi:hypothetical protein [Variovorax sp. dw_308]|uniref:hypothetical protein n=1 Tax=Variovorax sp. dw_308 TaxID=2721546 RepID=UPI001C4976B6|nr:hypothetical protein [Variovorax sp. dw_308]